jgi:hypothetical protein
MRQIRFYLLTATAFAVTVTGFVLSTSGAGQAHGQPGPQAERVADVRVVNTSAEPVPVLTRGTTNVSGSVSVTNTPTVNVGPGATVGIDPSGNAVQVANPETAPVAVRDVDFGRQPFHQSANFSFPDGSITRSTSISIPAGKRLVIEYVSGHLGVPAGQNITKIALGVTLNQQFADHFIIRTPIGDSGLGNEFFGASQQMRVYADDLFINVQRNSPNGTAGGTVTISGYLVDVT